jgi:hypothetical protein
MSMKNFPFVLALAILLALSGQAHAKHVTHSVTPENIDKQPFAFTVKVKDVGELKEIEITVRKQTGKSAPVRSATGSVTIIASGKQPATFPAVTKVQADDVQTYTFRVSASELDRARFTFTESPEAEFPSPGDYWVFHLSDFVGGAKK